MPKKNVPEGLLKLRAERDKLMADINEKSKKFFDENVQTLFEEFPKLKAFAWRQYTPYFNDGDTCEFNVHYDEPFIQYGDDEELGDFYFSTSRWDSKLRKSVPLETIDPILYEKKAAQEAIAKFLGTFENSDYDFMFGDHVEITVTREGTSKKWCDHD